MSDFNDFDEKTRFFSRNGAAGSICRVPGSLSTRHLGGGGGRYPLILTLFLTQTVLLVTKRGSKRGQKGPQGTPPRGTPPVFTGGGYPLTFKLSLSGPPQKQTPRGGPRVKSGQGGSQDPKNPAKNRSFFSDTPVFTCKIEGLALLRSTLGMLKNPSRHPEIGVHSGYLTPKRVGFIHVYWGFSKNTSKSRFGDILTSRPQKPRFSTQKS